MTGPVHPAKVMAFDDLWAGLQAAKAEKLVTEYVEILETICKMSICES